MTELAGCEWPEYEAQIWSTSTDGGVREQRWRCQATGKTKRESSDISWFIKPRWLKSLMSAWLLWITSGQRLKKTDTPVEWSLTHLPGSDDTFVGSAATRVHTVYFLGTFSKNNFHLRKYPKLQSCFFLLCFFNRGGGRVDEIITNSWNLTKLISSQTWRWVML